MVKGTAPASIVSLRSWHSFGPSHRAVLCLAKSISEAKATRRFSSKQRVICWRYDPSSLHTPWAQKQASGTWCRWHAVSFVALPRAHKILSVSYSWISHSLSRGVKDYIRSLTYIGLNSCSRVMEGLDGGNKLGKKRNSEHMPAAQPPQANGWNIREEWESFAHRKDYHLHQRFPSKWLCLCWGLELWHFGGLLNPVCEYIEHKRPWTLLGQPEAIVTNQEPSQSTQPQVAWFSWEVTVRTADLSVTMHRSLINTFDITSTLGINLQCSSNLRTFETCQN